MAVQAVKGSKTNRPSKVTSLLTEDVTFKGWEKESASKPRFYIRGVTWAMKALGSYEVSALKPFFGEAVDIITNDTDWPDQVIATPQDRKTYSSGWAEKPSYNQALRALNDRQPIVFFKAVQMLVAIEAALRDKQEKVDPMAVYEHMRIQPACYNIDNFNQSTLESLRNEVPDFNWKALDAIDQNHVELLEDLAKGSTVTKETAETLKRFVDDLSETTILLGEVRFQSGRRALGKKKASRFERVTA